MYYAQSTNGFYDKEIHGTNIPGDAVEITAKRHAELMDGQAQGMVITADSKGAPILVPRPEPTIDEKKAVCKAEAKKRLSDTDYSQAQDVRDMLENAADFDAYRAVVRDLFLRPIPEPVFPSEPNAVWRV